MLSNDKNHAWKLQHRAAKLCEIGEILYKKFFDNPLLWYLTKPEADKVIQETDVGGKSLEFKNIRLGYY